MAPAVVFFVVTGIEQVLVGFEENSSPAAYEMSKITATPTDSVFRSVENSTAAQWVGRPPPETSWKMAGMIMATVARKSISDCAMRHVLRRTAGRVAARRQASRRP
jgi:hypothetical protein